jgi:hypothetical protein
MRLYASFCAERWRIADGQRRVRMLLNVPLQFAFTEIPIELTICGHGH